MSRRIQLGGNRPGSPIRGYAVVDDEDYEWVSQYKWHLHNSGYAARRTGVQEDSPRVIVMLHREILGLPRNPGSSGCLQGNHLNANRLDNRRTNLEIVTPSGNNQHRWDRDRADSCPRCGGQEWSYAYKYRSCLTCKREGEKARVERMKQDPAWVENRRARIRDWKRKKRLQSKEAS